MQGARDRNIMNAWQNGGTFEGKKVTDAMVLAYWNKRDDTLDPGDPTYDAAKQQIEQLRYGIEQSKQDLLHVQGKINDQQYAQFFLKWAKKVPQASEFWRTLQKDAAQLMQSSKAASRATGDRLRVEAFNKFSEGLTGGSIATSNALRDAIYAVANETHLDPEANGDRILELLSQDYRANPGKYPQLHDAIVKNLPGFNGTFTAGMVAKQADQAEADYGKIAQRAKKEGYVSAYKAAADNQGKMASFGQSLNVWPVAKAYDKAYATLNSVLEDPNASEAEKVAASLAFSATAGKLAKTPGLDLGSRTMLEADSKRAAGQDAGDSPSFGPTVLGHAGITPELGASVARTMTIQAEATAHPEQWTLAPKGKDGTFDPTGNGSIGLVPASSVPADAVTVMVPGADGKPGLVRIPTHSILTATDPFDPKSKTEETGKTATYYVGGRAMTIYSFKNDAGQEKWTLASPVNTDGGATSRIDDKGNLIVTPPPPSVQSVIAQAQALDKQYGTNITAQIESAILHGGKATGTSLERNVVGQTATGKDITRTTNSNTITYENGKFTVKTSTNAYDAAGAKTEIGGDTFDVPTIDPATVVKASIDPSIRIGDHAGVTFDTPLNASVAQTASTQTAGQVAQMAQDPSFQRAFVTETTRAIGTTNPADPRVVAAWNAVTDRANDRTIVRMPNGRAIDRTDLNLPGLESGADPSKTNVGINFAGRDLKLPALPAYMQASQEADLARNMPSYLNALSEQEKAGKLPLGSGVISPSTVVSPTSGQAVTTYAVTPTPTPTPTPTTVTPTPTPVTTATPTVTPPTTTVHARPDVPTSQTWGGGA